RQLAVKGQGHAGHDAGARHHQADKHCEGDQTGAPPSLAIRRQLRPQLRSACADRLQGLAVGLQRGLLRPLGLLPHPLGVFSCLATPVIHQTAFIVPPLTADETLSWWGTPRSIYGLFGLLRISDCGLRIEYMDDRALKERTLQFVLAIFRMASSLPKTRETDAVVRQVIR